jgi:type VI secretion system protein ImpE
MTNAKDLYDHGQLSAAIDQLTQEVKAKPAEYSSRIFLFELLCFAGDLSRAEKQLDVIGHQSKEMEIGVAVYREVLEAERKRRSVFTEGIPPAFLTTPPDYVLFHLEALTLQRENQPEKARTLLAKALDMHPALAGQVNGQRFEEFEDSDLFLAPFLELYVNDKYAWLPFEQIKRIEFRKPAQLRDLLWAQVKIEAQGGDLGQVFLPVLYPGSSFHASDAVRLGRETDWIEIGAGLTRGAGQRLFVIDGKERLMLEIAEIVFDSVVQAEKA